MVTVWTKFSCSRRVTYTWEFRAAVAAFRGCASLSDMEESELTTGGLDHADIVG